MGLTIERHSGRALLALRFSGVIDERWNGEAAASQISAETVLIDLGGVRRISSFGIREWVDFIEALGQKGCEVVLVECSPKVVHQLNMVANFAGSARLYSFYAPYRCDYCDSEVDRLLRLDRDAELIASGEPPERPCERCGEVEYFDEDPATYFLFAAAAEPAELDDEVAAFLSSKLDYEAAPSARRMRADKRIEGTATFLRLTGDIDGSFAAETLADGLEGRVILELSGVGRIDPAGAAAWRRFVGGFAAAASSIWIVGAPPLFVEKLTGADDLGKGAVISIGLPYRCDRCHTSSVREVDVAEHAAVLKFATPPEMMCEACASPLTCVAGEELLARLPGLEPPRLEREARRQIARLRAAGAERARSTPPPPRRSGRSALAVAAAAVAVAFVVAAALLVYAVYRDDDGAGPPGATRITESPRPSWAKELAPLSARCRQTDGGQVCEASSTLALSEQQASEQAQLIAVDEMAWARGWGDDDAASRRARLLGRLADSGDPLSPRFSQVAAERIAASRGVAEALVRAGGGTLDPELFVERWSAGGERRWRAFARLAIEPARIEKLDAAIGATATSDLGVTAKNFPPPLVWRHRDVRAGALIRSIDDGPLADLGLRPGYVVTAIGGQTVAGAASFVELLEAEVARLGDAGGQLRMAVHTGSGEPMTFVRDWRPPEPEGPGGDRRPPPPPERPTFNTWEEAGGDPGDDPRR